MGAKDRIFATCCNANARRKFTESKAKANDPVADAQALAMYRGLYDIEDRVRDASVEERLELRKKESVPIMNELYDWLIEKRNEQRVLPKSSLGKAVRFSSSAQLGCLGLCG